MIIPVANNGYWYFFYRKKQSQMSKRLVHGVVVSTKPNRVRGEVEELRGRHFGHLLVIDFDHKDKQGRAVWQCLCDCGKTCHERANHLKSGAVVSCGHVNREKTAKHLHNIATRHGASHEPWYPNYMDMATRVMNPNQIDKQFYNQNRIKGKLIEQSWLENPWEFYKEIGDKPEQNYTIDRINPELGYVKGNVRWASKTLQALNRRKDRNSQNKYRGIITEHAGVNRRAHDKYVARGTIHGKAKRLGNFYLLRNAMRCRYDFETKYHIYHTFERPAGNYEPEPDYTKQNPHPFIRWNPERKYYRVTRKIDGHEVYVGSAKTLDEAIEMQKHQPITKQRNHSKVIAIDPKGIRHEYPSQNAIRRAYHTQAHIFRGQETETHITSKRSPFYGWTFQRASK